jgi:hypothetical protein
MLGCMARQRETVDASRTGGAARGSGGCSREIAGDEFPGFPLLFITAGPSTKLCLLLWKMEQIAVSRFSFGRNDAVSARPLPREQL